MMPKHFVKQLVLPLLCLGALLFLAQPSAAHAQTDWTESHQLLANNGSGGDELGFSTSVSGPTAIVGAPYQGGRGMAYVFDSSNGQLLFQLVANDRQSGDEFGTSVAVDETTAIIGARFDDDNGFNAGSAYIFDTSTGQQKFKLLASDGAATDGFGYSAAISGTTAIVGAGFDDNENGVDAGAAYLFDANTGQQLRKLICSDGAAGDFFGGRAVAIDGDTAIVGANLSDNSGVNSGAAYVFDTNTGEQLLKLLPSDAAPGDEFGVSVAMKDGIAIVGARYDDDIGSDSGSAYVFDVSTGQQLFKLVANDGASGDEFGTSAAFDGSVAVIGARFGGADGIRSGSVYIFELTTGQQVAELVASDFANDDRFGGQMLAVSISENTILVGAKYDDNSNGSNAGSAYLFKHVCESASYADPITFPAGNTTHGIASGDFNGDGIPDLVACNQFGNNATVLLGLGGGSFDAPYSVSVGSQPYFVVADDFNNDGLDDFVVSNFESNLATIRLGTPDGAFSAAASYPTGNGTSFPASTGVWYLQTADLNNDGNRDLVSSNIRHDFVSVMLGDGSGGFADPLLTDIAGPSGWSNIGPTEIAVADFNLDGNQDVAVPTLGNTDGGAAAVHILTGDGNGGLTVTASYTDLNEVGIRPRGITANDFNGDGVTDLMFNNWLPGLPTVRLFAGIGDGTFNVIAPVDFPVDSLFTVTSGDLNNDGHIDLMASETANGSTANVWRAFGNGDGMFQIPEAFVMEQSDKYPIDTILVDLDNSGYLDIASALNKHSQTGAIAIRLEVCESVVVGGDPVEVLPDSVEVTRGVLVSGGLNELADSDDADFNIRTKALFSQSRTEFQVKGVSPVANPTLMGVTLEGALDPGRDVLSPASTYGQVIEFYNYDSEAWEVVDSRIPYLRRDGEPNVVEATGDLSRFVETDTFCIEARVRYTSSTIGRAFHSATDQFNWNILP